MKLTQLNVHPWPLWLKICAALVCAMIAVSLIALQVDGKYRERRLNEELKQQSVLILKLISAGAQESVIMEDASMLDTLVHETVALDPNLNSLVINNESGEPMVEWQRADFTRASSSAVFEQAIDYEGELFGTVQAQWDPIGLAEKVDLRLARGRRTLMLALLCLTSLSLLLLHFLVASPIKRLANELRIISSGSKANNLEINSSREMSMFADAVNDLDTAMEESRSLAIELEHQATHDSLTGLKNRPAFESALKKLLDDRTCDSPEDVLLYFDLDQFKVINDTCGHAAGDDLLVNLVGILSGLFREGDIFARLGGDEFAALLPATTLETGQALAEEIRTQTQASRFNYEEHSFVIGVSIGIVRISEVDERPERIMTAADEACYAAKDSGRNRVHVFEENDEELSQRRGEMSWVPKIHAALASSDLILFGQTIAPTEDLNSTRDHVEVLVRMLNKDGEIIPPGAFLPAAERYGIMPKIDRWVIGNTLRWMEEQLGKGGTVPVCSINVSAITMSDQKFRDFLISELLASSVPAQSICFEMTETAAVSNLRSAVEFMSSVKDAGCQFALDDFGSGMSSFNYLKNMPVDFVKIDGAFVSPLMSDETCVVMVRAIGDIARVMGIKTIAEFVENDDIRNRLAELGIDYVQGYGIGKPQALSNFDQTAVRRAA